MGLTASGPTEISNTFAVSGATSLVDTGVAGNLTVTQGQTSVEGFAASGPTQVNNTFAVTGTSSLDDTGIAGNLTVTQGQTSVVGLTASGPTEISNTLAVTGATSLVDTAVAGNLTVTQGQTSVVELISSGPTQINNTFAVTGAATMQDITAHDVTVQGNLTLASGSSTVQGMSAADANISNTLNSNITLSNSVQAADVLAVGPNYASTSNVTFTMTNQLRQVIYGVVNLGDNDAADVTHNLNIPSTEYHVVATPNYGSDSSNLVSCIITDKTANAFTIKVLPINVNADTTIAFTLTHFSSSGAFAGGFA